MLTFIKTSLLYGTLLLWLAAVVLPLLWVFMSSIRSSREFVENPFGIPWLVTGMPADGRVSLQEWMAWHRGPGSIEEAGDAAALFLQRDTDQSGDLDAGEWAPNGAGLAEVERAVRFAVPWVEAKESFVRAWVGSGFSAYFLNSIIVVGISLFGILAVSAMAAYVLARFPFPGSNALFIYFLCGLMIPAQLVLVPLFFQFSYMSEWGSWLLQPLGLQLQLHDSLSGLILIYIALSIPFTVLVLTGFFKSLPSELRESAIMDGCGEYRAFWHVMLPLARPGIVTAAIFNFIGLWNEYLFALVFVNSPEKKTLPLGLASVSMQAQYKTDFGLMFAGLVIVIVPTLLVYIVLQRQLTRGITLGALKG